MKVDAEGAPHTFEMRTYTATPGNLLRLLDRFRQHTVATFSKHGMKHFGSFTPAVGSPGEDDTLLYFIHHASPAARGKSFAAFESDPGWSQVKVESENRRRWFAYRAGRREVRVAHRHGFFTGEMSG